MKEVEVFLRHRKVSAAELRQSAYRMHASPSLFGLPLPLTTRENFARHLLDAKARITHQDSHENHPNTHQIRGHDSSAHSKHFDTSIANIERFRGLFTARGRCACVAASAFCARRPLALAFADA